MGLRKQKQITVVFCQRPLEACLPFNLKYYILTILQIDEISFPHFVAISNGNSNSSSSTVTASRAAIPSVVCCVDHIPPTPKYVNLAAWRSG